MEASHGGGVAAEPQLGAEGAVLDPAGFADVTPLVLGGCADSVLDVRVVCAGQAQVLEGCTHDEGVGVHHVGVYITPGTVERVVAELDEVAVLVAVEANQRVVQALSAVGDQLVVGAVVAVGVDFYGEGVLVGDNIPVRPGGDTEAQGAVISVAAGCLQRGRIRGSTDVLQVRLNVAVQGQGGGSHTVHARTVLESAEQGAVAALVDLGAAQRDLGLGPAGVCLLSLVAGGLLGEGDGVFGSVHGAHGLGCHVNGQTQRLGAVFGEDESAGCAGNVLTVLFGNGFVAGVVVSCVLGGVHCCVAGLLQLGRVDAHGDFELLSFTGCEGDRGGEGVFHAGNISAFSVGQGIGVCHGVGVLDRHLAGEGLNASIRCVLEHTEAQGHGTALVSVVDEGLRLHSSEGVDSSGAHTVHRVCGTGFGAHIVGCGVHEGGLDLCGGVGRVALHDQGGGAGHVGCRHGGAAEGHGVVTGRHRRGGDVRAGCRNVGLGVAVAAVEAAGTHGVQLIQLIGVHAQGGLQLVAEAHGQGLTCRFCCGDLCTQVLSGGCCQAETGQGIVTGNTQAGFFVIACKQHALGACRLQVVEAHLGAAGEFTVVFSPVDEHPLALYSCRFVGAEGVAGVAVVLGDCGEFTGEFLGARLCPGVGDAVIAAYLAGGAGGGVGQLCRIDGAGGAVGVSYGDCAGCGGGVTGVGVGVAAQAVVVGVTCGDHGEHAGAGERVNGVGFGVVLRGEFATEGHVDHVHTVGEVAVTVGVEGTVERLNHDVGAAAATEDAEGVDFSVGGDAGADLHGLELLCGELAVVAGEGASVGVHAVACRGARHVGTVAAGGAVERVAVGGCGVATVVGVTDEVVAASNLGAVDESGVCGGQLGELGCLLVVFELAATAEVGVGVVDAGVDDGDLHALAGVSARAGGVGGAGPGGEGACVNGGARVLAVLGQDGRDLLYVGAVGECLDGLCVTAHCHAAYCVVGGVEDLRAGLAADLLCLALHLGGDCLHL